MNKELLEKAIAIHHRYETEGVFQEELSIIKDEVQNYIDSLPMDGDEPSTEEKLFIDQLLDIQIKLVGDAGMMNEGYILRPEIPGYRLHFYDKDATNSADDSDPFSYSNLNIKVLCAKLEPIK